MAAVVGEVEEEGLEAGGAGGAARSVLDLSTRRER